MWELFPGTPSQPIQSNKDRQLTEFVTTHWLQNSDSYIHFSLYFRNFRTSVGKFRRDQGLRLQNHKCFQETSVEAGTIMAPPHALCADFRVLASLFYSITIQNTITVSSYALVAQT
jgi:hypothetical protein